MATLVSFHAHPDDESIAMGGVMAKASDDGHRVVLVVATRGEHGEVADGFLDAGEQLWQRRVEETKASAAILGVARVEFLGYVDSGMIGTPENDAPESFWQADIEEAAARLAAILVDEKADVLTVYDEIGNYGHPDHIQVHRVGLRAAELAGTPRVYMNTVNRDFIRESIRQAAALGLDMSTGDDVPAEDFEIGVAGERITTTVDVRPWLARKRASMAAHASQISETSFFLSMPPAAFEHVWGQEWFIRCDAPVGLLETDIFDGVG
ncbi:MAG TPA: PIG-L family deacetylase [Acidimicrobiales bacterium]|jgi:LmbE family N-acetylglucosaminyl deacetylase|nr:PIG-L family deacetylase [Acidimicrobiales bacterium]